MIENDGGEFVTYDDHVALASALATVSSDNEHQAQRIADLEAERVRWVPVTERLPESYGTYPVLTNLGLDWSKYAPAPGWGEGAVWQYRSMPETGVTHWLDNVPPPPQGDTDGTS